MSDYISKISIESILLKSNHPFSKSILRDLEFTFEDFTLLEIPKDNMGWLTKQKSLLSKSYLHGIKDYYNSIISDKSSATFWELRLPRIEERFDQGRGQQVALSFDKKNILGVWHVDIKEPGISRSRLKCLKKTGCLDGIKPVE